MCSYASRLIREMSNLTNFEAADYYLELSDHLDSCLSSPCLMRAPSMTNPSRIWSSLTVVANGIPQSRGSPNSACSLSPFPSPFLLWQHRGENWRQKPWRTQVEIRTNLEQPWDKRTNRITEVYKRVIHMQKWSAHSGIPEQRAIWDGSHTLPHLFNKKEQIWKGERERFPFCQHRQWLEVVLNNIRVPATVKINAVLAGISIEKKAKS